MAKTLGERIAIDGANSAAEITQTRAKNLAVAAAALRYVLDVASANTLTVIGHDAGLDELTHDDLVAANVAVSQALEREIAIKDSLHQSAQLIEIHGLSH